MSIYYRYQPLHAAEQHLYCAGCPVFVHRYQVSADLQTGGRVLQVRMVNMSEWDIAAVFLRISCLDANGSPIATMYAVPVNGVRAVRGSIFGENCVIRLSPADTFAVQIFPERVVYANGSAWNETEASAYVTVPAPIPVRRNDPDFDRLEQQAQATGVHNDFRYQELSNIWYCTCGLPNHQRRQFCGYCSTNREWLRLNMNSRSNNIPAERVPSPEPEPEKATEPEAPEASEAQEASEASAVSPFGISDDPTLVELLDYMNRKMEQFSAPLTMSSADDAPTREPELEPESESEPEPSDEDEFPIIPAKTPRPRRAGKFFGILLLILAIAATAAFCVFRFLLPQLKYNRANALEAAGSYAEARAIFSELGDFSDSSERITGTWYQEALADMREGSYADAYEIFARYPGYENSISYAADCLYSQGVLAFNDGDAATAWDFAEQLEANYPNYANTVELKQNCCYSFGNDALTAEDFAQAKDWFVQAGDYKNSAELSDYCSYELALQAKDAGDYELAAESFRTCSYGDSESQMLECMMLYVEGTNDPADPLTETYLQTLCDADYEGAQELSDRLYAWDISFVLNTSEDDAAAAETLSAKKPGQLFIHYSVEGGRPGDTVSVIIIYTLPDGKTGNAFLLDEVEAGTEGVIRWTDIPLPSEELLGKITLKFCNADTGEELRTVTVEITGE